MKALNDFSRDAIVLGVTLVLLYIVSMAALSVLEDVVTIRVDNENIHHGLVDGIYMIKTPKEYQTLVIEHGVGRFPFESPKDGEYPVVNLKTLRKIPKCLPEGRRITRR